MSDIELAIHEGAEEVLRTEFSGTLELGRQRSTEKAPYARPDDQGGRMRIVIARSNEDTISRRHALIEQVDDFSVNITNLSDKRSIALPDLAAELPPGASRRVDLPAMMNIGSRTLQFTSADHAHLQTLDRASFRPGQAQQSIATLDLATLESTQVERLVYWLQSSLDVLQSAAVSSDFFARAARAVVDNLEFDSAQVLTRDGEGWKVEAVESRQGAGAAEAGGASSRVLNSICAKRRTHWELPGHRDLGASLQGVQAVIAAPILDRAGEVIGALYGVRRSSSGGQQPQISRVQALLLELLAGSVAAGLARVEQEKQAVAARVQFEQFFTPELSRELADNPDLLEGRDREITTLFCDIRGFTRISHTLGPEKTVKWINDVLTVLSECVIAHKGVLVDYSGDAMAAMWGAPGEQPDHAALACRAALDMVGRLPELNRLLEIDETTAIGVGINTGLARVGNIGSRRKFKYGPLGTAVNVASRTEGVTKKLHVQTLITRATHQQLCDRNPDEFHTRRLCTVRLRHCAEPVALYELIAEPFTDWEKLRSDYETALAAYESGEFRDAARILGGLFAAFPDDQPTIELLSRTVQAMTDDAQPFDPVWEVAQ